MRSASSSRRPQPIRERHATPYRDAQSILGRIRAKRWHETIGRSCGDMESQRAKIRGKNFSESRQKRSAGWTEQAGQEGRPLTPPSTRPGYAFQGGGLVGVPRP